MRLKKRYILLMLLALTAGMSNTAVKASDKQQIESILLMSTPPEGIVFEILAAEDGLSWAIPRVQQYASQLRGRFPQLAIAVVSHGREQFALQTSHQQENRKIHTQVKSLLGNQVQLHVCGTYAEWKGVSPEDFPDYVDVAAEGPAQIKAYMELGYMLIKLEQPPTP
ncbi:MAG: hypothetical protein OEX12_06295 [Gammaproteobacteria bacterium]|nr:hypothetical protein [Gammaproteobacteria bacterium]